MTLQTLGSTGIALFVALLVTLGSAAIWGAASLFLHAPCAWMAPVIAVDTAIVLRLASVPGGRGRGLLALLITAIAIALGAFTVAALQIGIAFGILPHEAVWNIGAGLARTWWQLNLGPWDSLVLILALPLAWWSGR